MATSGVFLKKEVLRSKAFKELTKTEITIYLEFLLKRRFGERNSKIGKKLRDVIKNNGRIVFTYSEAIKRLNISNQTFRRSVDKLIKVGFIDIARQGQGGIYEDGKITGEATLYFISDRWMNYQTPNFVKKKRLKDNRKGRGWAAYHAKKDAAKIEASG